MKCERCGNVEASFHYTESINGNMSEYHLCSDCAREEGFDRVFAPVPVMSGILSGAFFGGPLMFTAGAAFAEPAAVCGTCEREASEDAIPESAGDELRKKRELKMLRHQMKSAAKAEDFEKAAELRDKIRALEQE